MKNFATDLWNDLRAKRLWPVALLLLTGLIAVPAFLSKGAEEPPPAPAPTAGSARSTPDPEEFEGLASVELEETLPSEGSSLDTFDPSNPFRPPEKVLQKAEQPASGTTAAGPTGDTAASDSGSDGSSGFGGGTGSKEDTGSTGGSGNDEGGGSGDGSGTTTTTTEYTWVIDLTFSNNGQSRKLKGFERLDMLPSRASPLLLFLGVSSNGGNAVFLVDSTLKTAGEEGKCRPRKAKCAFLYLGAGSAQVFTNDDGDAYGLRIDHIRKVKLNETPSATNLKKGAKASAALSTRRRSSSPLISDLQSVSTVVEKR